MYQQIWNNWLLIGLIPPLLYGIVAIFDAYFVDTEVFRNPREATIITAFLGSLPLFAPITGVVDFTLPEPGIAAIAFLTGVMFVFHVYFYVAGLFRKNDTVLAETIQNLSVLIVPFLAYYLIGEILKPLHYLGIGIAGIGVVFMYCYKKPFAKGNFSGGGNLMIAAILFSLTLVAGEWVYQHTDFWSGYFLFCGGMLATCLCLYLIGDKNHLPRLMIRHWRPFLLIEAITTVGVLCSQRAVDISPSATFVAIIECFGAYFVLLLSAAICWTHKSMGIKINTLAQVCKQQLVDYPAKIIAGICISSSIYLIYSY